ncbi:MAG: CoA-binding protein [Actinomycetota bacterium]|nr:CoA-binding protein [Actinomycetota bacterium]
MSKELVQDMRLLFEPNVLAFVGASNNPGKWGHRILRNILNGGFRGSVFPVNPRAREILGIRVFPNLSSIPKSIDTAIICTPAEQTLEIVRECARCGVKFAVVISAGFSEIGESGRQAEIEMVKAAGKCRLVGPNTMGIMSAKNSLYAYMSLAKPRPGPVSFISQSGNLGTQILGRGQKQAIGFSRFVSIGNEADLSVADYLSFLANDESTGVVLSYLEGLKDARTFLESASRVTSQKPLIVFKAGRTEAGARAARSHCGALASRDSICDGAFLQSGIVRASTTEEILDLAKAFSSFPLPRGKRVAILTWGGGWGVIGADICHEIGFELTKLSNKTIDKIDRLLPPYWSRGNPIDLAGSLSPENHLECLEILAKSDEVDLVLALGTISGFPDSSEQDENFLRRTIELIGEYKKPIALVKTFEGYESEFIDNHGYLIFPGPERAAAALWKMYEYYVFRNRIKER